MAKHILVVEDDPFYGSILRAKLTKEGCEVTITKNGQEAIVEIGKRRPDLIVSNLIMPVMDGFTFLEMLHKDETAKGLKVLVLTNLGEEEDKKKVLALGAFEYVVKVNVALDDIIRKIKTSAGAE